MPGSLTIRPIAPQDVPAADRVHRLAFGTFFGLPDPTKFRGDAEVIRTRAAADAAVVLVAEQDGQIIGSALGMDWGSVFIVGPVTVHPEQWSRGVARLLMAEMDRLIAARPVTLTGLFTHPASTKHVRLYESYGFVPQFITGVMSKPVEPTAAGGAPSLYSALSPTAREETLQACRRLTDRVYPGLDLTREIRAVADQHLGDTVLRTDGQELTGFAVCHVGPGSEAGGGRAFVKFAAVRPGDEQEFRRLLADSEALAVARQAGRLIAGVNSGRRAAYRVMQACGFRADMNGIAMHRPDQPGYNRPEIFAIDDWR
ncbi:MAG TPA: GNAT family N-acetyltransferase [Alphaproteobacteria bacterium]